MKNECLMYNKHLIKYLIVKIGSLEYLEAIKKNYEFRGCNFVATIIESNEMRIKHQNFIR